MRRKRATGLSTMSLLSERIEGNDTARLGGLRRFGASDGVGFMIRKAYQEFQVDDMLAWTTLFIVAMILIERGLAYLENRFFAWRKDIS